MQQKSSGGMPAKRFIALIALVALAVAVIVFAVREIRLYGDVQVEQSRTPTPVPGYGNVMQVTIDPSLPTPVPVLRSGAQGEAVWQLQERLQALGYLTGSVDGQFGPATKEAVQLFQRQHGLTADGIVGEDTRELLYSDSAQPYATPTPAPTQTPEQNPTQSEREATVTAYGGLKLRQLPDTSSGTLTTMPYGSAVTVTGEAVNGFYAVSYEELSGYASAQYLSFDVNELQPTAAPTKVPEASHPVTGRIGTVTAPSGLNLRADSSQYANVLATLGYGVQVTVTGERVSGFYPVRIGTLSGYVSADYISFDAESAATTVPTATPAPSTGGYRVVVESDNGLNLRARPSADSDVLYVLPYGMVLNVLGEGENGFLYVQWGGYTGYVSGDYVTPFGAQ